MFWKCIGERYEKNNYLRFRVTRIKKIFYYCLNDTNYSDWTEIQLFKNIQQAKRKVSVIRLKLNLRSDMDFIKVYELGRLFIAWIKCHFLDSWFTM